MRHRGTTTLLVILLGALVGITAAFGAPALKTKVSGTWTLTLTATHLNPANTAGATFRDPISSLDYPSGSITVEIQNGTPPLWVAVSRDTASWVPGATLRVSIVPPAPGFVGPNYSPVTVTAASQDFYYTSSTNAVTIFYEMKGVSPANLAAAVYTTTVTYTLHP